MNTALRETKNFTFPLKPKDFFSWHEYYWTYQYHLAAKFHIPLMESWGVVFENAKILDVGCGDGGFTAAMADRGARCVGVEIKEFKRKANGDPRLRYVIQDVTTPDAPEKLGADYDLVVLRDVIEHIPLAQKENFLLSLERFLNHTGKIFFTFPPFYSPYGLHQQTALKSKLRAIPYLHYVPWFLLRKLATWAGEPSASLAVAEEIVQCRMTMRHFKQLARKTGMTILHEKHYFVRPSHEIRYGVKTRGAWFGKMPVLREILVSGATILAAVDGGEHVERL
jgi:2-polyprenyl-3-methyl-5-hydroxy-6-metoxy-1,4-benzoquinol methylase